MPRLALLLLTLVTALVAAAPAQAAESFLGVLADGRAVTFTNQTTNKTSSPRRIAGLEPGDRVVALTSGLALGRSGRLYRLRADLLRATPTRVQIPLEGANHSVIADPELIRARIFSDSGQDVYVDLVAETTTPGPGLRGPAGEPLRASVARLRDGRLAAIVPGRPALYVETAPGTNVMNERRLDLRDRVAFPNPVALGIAGDFAYALTGFPEELTPPQSRLLRINLTSGRVDGEGGPYFLRQLVAIVPTGTVPDDTTAPRLRVVSAPSTVSLRELRAGTVRVRVRCSEGCYVYAGTAVGGRSNSSVSATRATAGTLTLRLGRHTPRELRLLRIAPRKRTFLRLSVYDFANNRRVVNKRVRIVR